MELETKRLKLRQWREEDKDPFYAMCSDPEVMKYFPSVYDRKYSDSMVEKASSIISMHGWGFWACEIKDTSQFIGFVGLNGPDIELPFTPATEIGWRLAKQYWGNGYATEAAQKSLSYAFNTLKLDHVVSFAVKSNEPSIAVMKRLDMYNTEQNFNHPKVQSQHLKEHVLYDITQKQYAKNT